ncbi:MULTISPECIES: nitrogenase cofactor biosynthesis protein NifB [unclassified Bradyrhizobium]|uniref:nitrogenase cofactor biosynthesis protein NifB n=1 Tax=unclassified Bradyrhizobium TaxID=2631580 RepID=UPI001CD5C8CC|nr:MULTISPECIES: nitrogenase cofactor biosynthesis protein NifB [unclassified Bradyrhizobium]MCA1384265.1 nitrogenase cofactor biosynthesis protein NifB [Bradyrhizobium sp. BRP05]MCA1393588.1 nitrogenase cofactor biosynthesis protein NifB [Bradyrhizobium sp. IC3123]MCA1421007.1 nitrogenase cofactor biosynthesis protein NifB [Bradyrhizobium sp. BRP23]MCA1430733.1 nitrogenase cofactor biosynthesis protein NifB [Bradyrhizobium sp. NBAIM16]MCA1479933.1 nitrogenase cofactor biosynthesis protein Nif
MQPAPEHKRCRASAKTGQASCGSHAGQGDLPTEIWEKVKNHPCYSEEAHHHYARMHVAVAPACNLQCNYCNRKYDCANESRPGVVSEKLTPEQAVRKVLAVATSIPQMTVLGIAGPGDALANPAKTFKTFELVAKAAPEIKLCLSTNGLALPDYVDTIVKSKVDHVTITINMVDPEIGAKIYPWIFFNHKRYTGIDAARILTDRQLQGLEMLSERGILCKVNSVMIPNINDDHLIEVNKAVKSRGAFLHNIMPLISAPEHGTVFGLNGQRGPTAQELKALQDACEGEIKIMRHCRQCRADAVGLLGQDRSAEFTTDQVMKMDVEYDLEMRKAYQGRVEHERAARVAVAQKELAKFAGEMSAITLLVAVATKGSGVINEHFGHAKEFQVYELSTSGAKFVGHRRVDVYCQGGYGEEDRLSAIMRGIHDCHAVFVSKIGGCPKSNLIKAGIEPVDQYAHEFIEKSAIAWFRSYLDKVKRGEIQHAQRGDAAIPQGSLFSAG